MGNLCALDDVPEALRVRAAARARGTAMVVVRPKVKAMATARTRTRHRDREKTRTRARVRARAGARVASSPPLNPKPIQVSSDWGRVAARLKLPMLFRASPAQALILSANPSPAQALILSANPSPEPTSFHSNCHLNLTLPPTEP